MTNSAATGQAGPGLAALHFEMSKQHKDSLDSYRTNGEVAKKIAASVRRTGRLILLGMGGSQTVNRMAEPDYRALGVKALAVSLSEQLYSPLPLEDATVIITSQSGESAEVHRLFEDFKPHADTFGLTMEDTSALAKTCTSLIGRGGSEKAFCATRSLLISLTLHQLVLNELGVDSKAALAVLEQPEDPDVTAAANHLKDCAAVVFSGRNLRGLGEAAALGAMELGRMPAYALEGGQFRHGPMEILGAKVGVVIFRADEAAAALGDDLAGQAVAAGSPTVLFDASGSASKAAKAGAVHVAFKKAGGLAASLAMLPAAQRLVIELASQRVADVGTPVRSGKVTRVE